jgi:hypothetical protein
MSSAFSSLNPDGVYPTSITDPCGFSPLADMRYGLLWRVQCDRVLTMTTGPGLQHFRTFLTRGAEGIINKTYLGAAIPGNLCPDFHFKPHNDVWPTDANPIEHFSAASSLISLEAWDCDAMGAYSLTSYKGPAIHAAPLQCNSQTYLCRNPHSYRKST